MISTTLQHDVPDLTAFRIKYLKHHEVHIATEATKIKIKTQNKIFFCCNFSNHHRFSVVNFVDYLCTGCISASGESFMFHGNSNRMRCRTSARQIIESPYSTVTSLFFYMLIIFFFISMFFLYSEFCFYLSVSFVSDYCAI